MLKRTFLIFFLLLSSSMSMFINSHEVLMQDKKRPGNDQIYIEPPYVTYDDDLNELYVYFGSTGTIDLEYDDGTGAPYYYIYGESHYGGYTATYTYLPAGYYMITIHSVYGYTYYGNFTVS